jgi:hypothetical protein
MMVVGGQEAKTGLRALYTLALMSRLRFDMAAMKSYSRRSIRKDERKGVLEHV